MRRFSLTQLHAWWCQYCQYRRSRLHLLALDDRLLNDIGITRQQARKEGHKAAWKQAQAIRSHDETR